MRVEIDRELEAEKEARQKMLKETAKNRKKAWYIRARDMDRERGTHIGTLGYLPLEIRQQIWGVLFDMDEDLYGRSIFEKYPKFWGLAKGRYDGLHPWDRGVQHLCQALPTLRDEFEHRFVAEHTCTFWRWEEFEDFKARFHHTNDKLRIEIFPFVQLRPSGEWYGRADLDDRKAVSLGWLEAFESLPQNLVSVQFNVSMADADMKFAHDLLDILRMRVRRNAPNAVLKFAEFEAVKNCNWSLNHRTDYESLRKVVFDVE